MPYAPLPKDTSEESLKALDDLIANEDFDPLKKIAMLETEAQAAAFLRSCERELEECRNEEVATEVLEVVSATTSGAISTWETTSGVPLGTITNYVVGVGSKIGSIMSPENRALRMAVRTGKVFLHSQLAITARNVILKNRDGK